jgi:hypothetical protein
VLIKTRRYTVPPSRGTLDEKGTQDNVTLGAHNQTTGERDEHCDAALIPVKANLRDG